MRGCRIIAVALVETFKFLHQPILLLYGFQKLAWSCCISLVLELKLLSIHIQNIFKFLHPLMPTKSRRIIGFTRKKMQMVLVQMWKLSHKQIEWKIHSIICLLSSVDMWSKYSQHHFSPIRPIYHHIFGKFWKIWNKQWQCNTQQENWKKSSYFVVNFTIFY